MNRLALDAVELDLTQDVNGSWIARSIAGDSVVRARERGDLPVTDESGGWLVLDTGDWGTLAATMINDGRMLLGVWRGYSQQEGIILAWAQARAILASFKPEGA
jgi:hypothetical protein